MPGEERPINLSDLLDFLIETAKDLIECGCSSNRLERLITRIADPLDVKVDVLAIPTGVWIKVDNGMESRIDLIRVKSWAVNLHRMVAISDVVDEYEAGHLTLRQAKVLIREASEAPAPYNLLLTMLAGGLSAVVITFLLGGSLKESGIAFIPGCIVQFMTKFVFLGERRYLADFISSLIVGLFAIWCSTVDPQIDAARIIVGGIIGLLPGLVLVNAIHELAQKNLLSGTVKCFEAIIISASLAFGILIAVGIYLVSFQ